MEKKAAGKLGWEDWGGGRGGLHTVRDRLSEKLTFVQTLGVPEGKSPGRER